MYLFAAVQPIRARNLVYVAALGAACRGESARRATPPDTVNLYAAAGANALSGAAARARPIE